MAIALPLRPLPALRKAGRGGVATFYSSANKKTLLFISVTKRPSRSALPESSLAKTKATHKSTLSICVSLPKEGDRGLPILRKEAGHHVAFLFSR